MWLCRGIIQVSWDSPEFNSESPLPSKCLRANWDNWSPCPRQGLGSKEWAAERGRHGTSENGSNRSNEARRVAGMWLISDGPWGQVPRSRRHPGCAETGEWTPCRWASPAEKVRMQGSHFTLHVSVCVLFRNIGGEKQTYRGFNHVPCKGKSMKQPVRLPCLPVVREDSGETQGTERDGGPSESGCRKQASSAWWVLSPPAPHAEGLTTPGCHDLRC